MRSTATSSMFVSSDRIRVAPGSETPAPAGAGPLMRPLPARPLRSLAAGAHRPRRHRLSRPAARASRARGLLAHPVRLGNLGEREGLRDREREAPGLDQLADLGERVDRAASVPAAEPHPMLLGAAEVGDRHDVLQTARELDELGKHPAPGDIKRDVNAVGHERANPLDQAFAVGDGLGPQ